MLGVADILSTAAGGNFNYLLLKPGFNLAFLLLTAYPRSLISNTHAADRNAFAICLI